MAIPQKHLSLEEFLRLPEEKPVLEFEDGVVTQKGMPGAHHSVLQLELTHRMSEFVEPARSARAFLELRTTYAGRSYVPDVALYLRDRIPVDDHGMIADDFLAPPDIAAEVALPSDGANRLVRRCLWYRAHGVQTALLVDPVDESVLLSNLQQIPRVLQGSDKIDLSAVLPGFELTVEELFASLYFG